MILQYKDYTITGTVEGIIDFIKANEPITLSNGSNLQYMGKTLSGAFNSDLVGKMPKKFEIRADKLFDDKEKCYNVIIDYEYFKKHQDFFNQFSWQVDDEDEKLKYYYLYLTYTELKRVKAQLKDWGDYFVK